MPKIPLYNRTGQPTQELATGNLGPRASIDAFASPSQAVARLGQTIGRAGAQYSDQMNEFESQKAKIQFEFEKAEQDAETEKVFDETLLDYNQKSSDLRRDNLDTTTGGFRGVHDEFNKRFLQEIDARTDLAERQKRTIKSKLMPTLISEMGKGEKEAFGRGLVVRGQTKDQSIQNKIENATQFGPNHPERKRLTAEIEQDILRAERDNLKIRFSVNSVKTAFELKDYQTRIIAAQTSNDVDGILRELTNSATLGYQSKSSLRSLGKTRKGEIRGDAAEAVTSGLQTLDVSFEDQDILTKAARDGDVYTGVDDTGSEVVIDFSTLDAGQRSTVEFTTIPKYFKDIEDSISQDLVSTALDNYEVSEERGIGEFALNYSDEARALHNKTDTELAEIGVETAKQIVNDVSNNITSGDFDAGVAASRLQAMENLLSTEFGGNVPFIENVALKNDAQNVMSNIASARKSLATAAKKQNKIINAEQAFVKGTVDLESQALDLSEPEKQQAITNVLARESDIQEQLQLLQENAVSSEQFSKILVRGISRLSDVNKTELDDDDRQAISLFENMQVRPGMLNNHLKGDDLRRWKSFGILSDIYGFEGALQQMKTQRDEIDVNIRMADIENQLDISIDEVTEKPWYKFDLDPPQNVGDMLLGIKNLTREYIRMNIPSDDALEQAAADYFESHQLVRNIMIPKADFPKGLRKNVIDNISEIADIVVDDFVRLNPTLFEDSDLEPENIGIRPISNTIDKFYLVRDGGFLLQNENEQYVSYTVAELAKAQVAATKRKKAQALKDLNEALKGNIPVDDAEQMQRDLGEVKSGFEKSGIL